MLGAGLWQLGIEDPSVWSFFGKTGSGLLLRTARKLPTIDYETVGEAFHIQSLPRDGHISLTFDTDATVDYAEYTDLPSGYILERVGAALPEKSLILTFDDGPDPQWTPKILDVLRVFHVPATFFVVGDQAEHYPSIVQQIAREGHLIGNHTYLHPDLTKISQERLRVELNSTL